MVFRRRPKDDADHEDERVVELACLPLWQAQLVLHHLWEAGVPTTMSEGGLGTLKHWANEPTARLWVMEHRLAEARAALAEVVDP
jgi:hypothetical protein